MAEKIEKKKSILSNSSVITFAAMIIGAVLGLLFGDTMSQFKFIGDIWLNCIKMIIVPLVFCIMTLAVGGQSDLKNLGRIAARILTYYICTTILASIIGLAVASIIKPGMGMTLEGLAQTEVTGTATFTLPVFFASLFSNNIFESFTNGNVIQTMVIAILFGISILQIKNAERKALLLKGIQSINDMIFVYIGMVIKAAPIGVLFLMADSFGKYGFAIFSSMVGLIGTFWLSILVQLLLVYCTMLWFTAGINPIRFIKDSAAVWTFTIAACSSSANIPVGIRVAKEKFNVPSRIADFCIPLGAQVNYDGSALLYACVLIFISQMYGISFDLNTMIKIVLVSTILSSSGGGIPGSGIVKLLVIVGTFGLPVEIVGIIAGFYRFFDMGTTTGNCLGDLVGTVCVSKWEEKRAEKLGIPFGDEAVSEETPL